MVMVSQVEDQLQLTSAQLDSATNEARAYWYSLADEAIALLQDGTTYESISPQDFLYKVPAFPATQVAVNEITLSDEITKALLTIATSTMRVAEAAKCNAHTVTKDIRAALLIGIQSPISCNLSGTTFQRWQGAEGQRTPNLVGVLSLAWAYILSAYFIEIQQQEGAEIVYTDSAAPWQHYDMNQNAEDSPSIKVDVGKVDERAARWWAAILAPSQGWKATVTKRNGTSYISPWSLCLENEPGFGIIWQDTGAVRDGSTPLCPLSFQSALDLLADFCFLHDLGGQYWAAFSAALTFPTHKQYEMANQLPRPTIAQGQKKPASNGQLINEYLSVSRDLPYYISLSCNYSALMSSLCGSFWEPSIACNLVSPWLHPILEEIPKATEVVNNTGRHHEIIALSCGMRRPRLRALWVGAALSGLVPKVIDFVRSGTPPLDPNGFSWTASPQSFMDLCGSGPYFYRHASGENAIRRIDAWRLLYLPAIEDDGLYYNSLPFSPWYPVGVTVEKNCVLRVCIHKSCSRHHLVNTSWSWQLQDGSSLDDRGFREGERDYLQQSSFTRSHQTHSFIYPRVALSLSQDASRAASLEAFRWVLANHEGKPCSEPIYDDDWIAGCDYSDECYSATGEILHSGITTNSNEEIFPQELKGCIDQASSLQGDPIREWIENTL